MIRRSILRLMLLGLLVPSAGLAGVSLEWTRYYGDSTNELPHKVIEVADGGFALVGHDYVGWHMTGFNAARISPEGDLLYQASFPYRYSNWEYGQGALPHPDGGLLLAGINVIGGKPFTLMRIGEDGKQLWRNSFGVGSDPSTVSLFPDGDGFLLVGSIAVAGNAAQIHLFEVDKAGNVLNTSKVALPYGARTEAAIRTSDGGIAILANVYYPGGIYGSALLLRVTRDGELLWSWTSPAQDALFKLVETLDGGFVLAGSTEAGEFTLGDMLVTKVDFDGESLWRRTYDVTEQEYLTALVATPDGGFLAAGTVDYMEGPYLLRLNGSGRKAWDQVLAPPADEIHPSAFSQVDDLIPLEKGGFALAGTASGYHQVNKGTNDIDGVLCKLGPVEPLKEEYLEISIDIRPGNVNNQIVASANGLLPVVVFSDASFDALTLDLDTIRLEEAQVSKNQKGRAQVQRRDLNRDGRADLLVWFRMNEIGMPHGTGNATLTGETRDGELVRGSDRLTVIGTKKRR
jgi:hypothetical protein